jgi:uncharacterized small protein (DUF1192 family)
MAMFDEEPARSKRVHEIGQDLSLLSTDEIEARIGQLRGEIERLEAELQAKGSTRLAAEALFQRG